jgi:hypothetical protein
MIDIDIVSETYADLTLNLKNSITNFLLFIALIDENSNRPNQDEIDFLLSFKDILNFELIYSIGSNQSLENIDQMIGNLIQLNDYQKNLLMTISFELINIDEEANETELKMALFLYHLIGIDKENYINEAVDLLNYMPLKSRSEQEFNSIKI